MHMLFGLLALRARIVSGVRSAGAVTMGDCAPASKRVAGRTCPVAGRGIDMASGAGIMGRWSEARPDQ